MDPGRCWEKAGCRMTARQRGGEIILFSNIENQVLPLSELSALPSGL